MTWCGLGFVAPLIPVVEPPETAAQVKAFDRDFGDQLVTHSPP